RTADALYTHVEALHRQMELEHTAALRRLDAAINRLRPKQRQVIKLLRQRLTLEQVAARLALPPTTVQGRWNGAIKQLRKVMHPLDIAMLCGEVADVDY